MAMNHSQRDSVDAAARNRARTTGWHPILGAVETEPGHWLLVSDQRGPYAVVRMLRIGGEQGYRAVTWAERSEDRRLVGYFRSLRAACEAAHRVFLRSHGPGGFAPRPLP